MLRRISTAMWMTWVCLICLAPAGYGASRPVEGIYRRKVNEQKKENSTWEREAKKEESRLLRIGHRHYKQKEYRKAASYYRDVLAIRYPQWLFKESTVANRTTLRPRDKKKWFRLDTDTTRTARQRLDSMRDAIENEEKKEAERGFKRWFEEAEVATMLNDDAKAYRVYERIIKVSEKLIKKDPRKWMIQQKAKAEGLKKGIVTKLSKGLDEVTALIKQKKAAEAIAKLKEYERSQRKMMGVIPELRSRARELGRSPLLRAQNREQEVARRIQMGDGALARGDYLRAERMYEEATTIYPDAKNVKTASEKLAKMRQDPKIAAALKQQAMEADCKPLLLRAEMFMEQQEYGKAKLLLESIVEKYPKSSWAKQAEDLLGTIKGGTAAAG